jgi:hypothetical protein
MAVAPEIIPREQWAIYDEVLQGAERRGIPFALAGAFAVGLYTGAWRNTKDLDLAIVERDRDAMIDLMSEAGLERPAAVRSRVDLSRVSRWRHRGCDLGDGQPARLFR